MEQTQDEGATTIDTHMAPLTRSIDPRLVHRILLTDPSDFDLLQPRSPQITFEEFQENLYRGEGPDHVMKRAFHDHLRDKVDQEKDWEPLERLLLELHTSIRALVPNRPDLHTILKDPSASDENVRDAKNWLPKILRAAQALEKLESEVRSQSTRSWVELATSRQNETDVSFLVASTLYLLEKAEQCQQDKEAFYLSQVVAPRLYHSGEGQSLERQIMQERFGAEPQLTKAWLGTILPDDATSREALRSDPKSRRDLIQTGWIQTILFQSERQTAMPEIFANDMDALYTIRQVTRTAAAGCALGWHACQASERASDTLLQDESQGRSLVQVMTNRRTSSVDAYETAVADEVVRLAQSWNRADQGPLEPQTVETLFGQVRSVLRGKDAVLKLLDDRMRQIFVSLATDILYEALPAVMASGSRSKASSQDSSFSVKARETFRQRGLAFYAKDLAHAADLAAKVGRLAYTLYADEFLDQMIVDAL